MGMAVVCWVKLEHAMNEDGIHFVFDLLCCVTDYDALIV